MWMAGWLADNVLECTMASSIALVNQWLRAEIVTR